MSSTAQKFPFPENTPPATGSPANAQASSATDQQFVHILSQLTLGRIAGDAPTAQFDLRRIREIGDKTPLAFVASLNAEEREKLLATADSHHVIIRAFAVLHQDALLAGNNDVAEWTLKAITTERTRIDAALSVLDRVVRELNANSCPTTVIKTLDHWPDLGNDLDLYTTGDERNVVRVMLSKFNAHTEARSWGDRLAQKWNFVIPGLRESIEVHCQRLGQTGEHIAMAKRFVTRRMFRTIQGFTFPVPSPEERVIVATLQRMYRHFYFRLSDIINSAALLDQHNIDFDELRNSAEMGGIWPGTATYLKLVCDYVKRYRGSSPALPPDIEHAAIFSGDVLTVKNCFIRVPIMPYGAQLYTRQVTKTALRGDVPATFRLSLLPPLASVAAIAYKFTGSDKGIW